MDGIDESEEFETQTDILTLLENVKCQTNNPSGIKQALQALATICCSGDKWQDYFRTAGGVTDVKDMIVEGFCPFVSVPAALFCLACAIKENVASQTIVLTEDLMNVLHQLFSHQGSSDEIIKSAAFLLACAVSYSGKGQNLSHDTQCLQDLVTILRDSVWSGCGDESKWSAVTRAIAVCLNNPQNERNQRLCCSLLPHALKVFSNRERMSTWPHALNLISVVVTNNVFNQERVRCCGGISTLAALIKDGKNTDIPQLSGIIVNNAVSTLNACIAENSQGGIEAARLDLIPVLLSLLDSTALEPTSTQTIVLTLAHMLEAAGDYCSLVSQGQGHHTLVRLLTDTEDDELCRAIKYILTMCRLHKEAAVENNCQLSNGENGDVESLPVHLQLYLNQKLQEISDEVGMVSRRAESIERANETFQKPNIQDRRLRTSQSALVNEGWTQAGEHNEGCQRKCAPKQLQSTSSIVGCGSQCTDYKDMGYRGKAGMETTPFISFKQTNCERGKPGQDEMTTSRDQYNTTDLKSQQTTFTAQRHSYSQHGGHCRPLDEVEESYNSPELQVYKHCQVNDLSSLYRKQNLSEWEKNLSDPEPIEVASLLEDRNNCYSRFDRSKKKIQNASRDASSAMMEPTDYFNRESTHGIQAHVDHKVRQKCEVIGELCLPQPDMHVPENSVILHKFSQNNPLSGNSSVISPDRRSVAHGSGVITTQTYTTNKHGEQTKEGQCDPQMRPVDITAQVEHPGTSSPTDQILALQQNQLHIFSQFQNMISSFFQLIYPSQSGMGTDTVHVNQQIQNAKDPENQKGSSALLTTETNTTINNGKAENAPITTEMAISSTLSNRTDNPVSVSASVAEPAFQVHKSDHNVTQTMDELISNPRVPSCDRPISASVAEPAFQVCKTDHNATQTIDELISNPEVPSCVGCVREKGIAHDKKILSNQWEHCKNNCDISNSSRDLSFQATRTSADLGKAKFSCKGTGPDSSFRGNINKNQCLFTKSPELETTVITKETTSVEPGQSVCEKERINKTETAFVKPTKLPLHFGYKSTSEKSRKYSVPHAGHTMCSKRSRPGGINVLNSCPSLCPRPPPPPSPACTEFDCFIKKIATKNRNCCKQTFLKSYDETYSSSACSVLPNKSCVVSGVSNGVSRNSCSADPPHPGGSRQNHMISKTIGSPTGQCEPLHKSRTQLSQSLDLPQEGIPGSGSMPPLKHTRSEQDLNDLDTNRQHPSCPGCKLGPELNSRTYNIALEASVHTCLYHRTLRNLERKAMKTWDSTLKPYLVVEREGNGSKHHTQIPSSDQVVEKKTVFEFTSESEEDMSSPELDVSLTSVKSTLRKKRFFRKERRPRVAYTEEELNNLREGVTKMGKHWQQILCTYYFHPSRTSVDLKDKYKRLMRSQSHKKYQANDRSSPLEFSMCEIRRLKRSVKALGYNWKAILAGNRFAPGRTAEDLRNKWRSLNKIL